MRFIKYSILPVILFISLVVCLLHYKDIEYLDNYSFTHTLLLISEYGSTDSYDLYVSRIKTDISNLKDYINHSPMFEEVPSYTEENDNSSFISNLTNSFRNFWNSITTFLSNVSNNNNAFVSSIGTFSYYIVALFPMTLNLVSLLFDTLALGLGFVGFAFNLFTI